MAGAKKAAKHAAPRATRTQKPKRVILFPAQPASIDPKIIDAAIRKVIADRRAKK